MAIQPGFEDMKEVTAKFAASPVRRQIRMASLADLLTPVARPKPQPSLRVPVTQANRLLLRTLRAAEEAAWENNYPNYAAFGQ